MSNNNNPPFHVGQRVVCVDDSAFRNPDFYKDIDLRKGSFYTISWIGNCYHGIPHVQLIEKGSINAYGAFRFAPIEPRHQDVEIVEELLKEPVPETLDKLKPVLS